MRKSSEIPLHWVYHLKHAEIKWNTITLGPTYKELGYNEHLVQQADFFASKQLTAMSKSSVTMSTRL